MQCALVSILEHHVRHAMATMIHSFMIAATPVFMILFGTHDTDAGADMGAALDIMAVGMAAVMVQVAALEIESDQEVAVPDQTTDVVHAEEDKFMPF